MDDLTPNRVGVGEAVAGIDAAIVSCSDARARGLLAGFVPTEQAPLMRRALACR